MSCSFFSKKKYRNFLWDHFRQTSVECFTLACHSLIRRKQKCCKCSIFHFQYLLVLHSLLSFSFRLQHFWISRLLCHLFIILKYLPPWMNHGFASFYLFKTHLNFAAWLVIDIFGAHLLDKVCYLRPLPLSTCTLDVSDFLHPSASRQRGLNLALFFELASKQVSPQLLRKVDLLHLSINMMFSSSSLSWMPSSEDFKTFVI